MLLRSPFFVAAAPHFLYCPGSRCGSAPAFFTDHFLLRQRPAFFLPNSRCGSVPAFYTANFSLRQRPAFFLPNSRCGSVPAFYTANFLLRQRPAIYSAHFSLRQRPGFLHCQVFVAAAPLVFILPFSRCGSNPLFILPRFSLRQRPRDRKSVV